MKLPKERSYWFNKSDKTLEKKNSKNEIKRRCARKKDKQPEINVISARCWRIMGLDTIFLLRFLASVFHCLFSLHLLLLRPPSNFFYYKDFISFWVRSPVIFFLWKLVWVQRTFSDQYILYLMSFWYVAWFICEKWISKFFIDLLGAFEDNKAISMLNLNSSVK